jgi:predicted RNase H-like HicB family nuclease
MKRDFNVIIEKDEKGYYIASVPELRGCHTQAKSLDELMLRIQDAIELCVEVQKMKTGKLDFIGMQRITVG